MQSVVSSYDCMGGESYDLTARLFLMEGIMRNNETYLGDGVYASFDGFQIGLRCDCMSVPNTIFLEDHVFRALVRFNEQILENIKSDCTQLAKPFPKINHDETES
jgi:hypothetical protein